MLDNVILGLSEALTLNNLYWCFVGVFFGTFLGALPGIGTMVAMSLLFPLTFHLDPAAAIIMLAGIYYGTAYGGSTASILLNLPGTPASAVACFDGHQMAKQGRAGIALMVSAIGSFVGGSIGIILMMTFSPLISSLALSFGPSEYVALIVLGLVAASSISSGSPIKGVAMIVLGILLGLVGIDVNSGVPRFTFGSIEFFDGIALVALAMGLFGVAEVVVSIREAADIPAAARRVPLRSMVPTRDDVSRSWKPMLRGSGIGAFLGALPGTGATIASFMSYAAEHSLAKDPSRFGKGAIEGVAGPETANNAADQTAFIPTLTLGIPGTASMALILGILMMHNITPGPNLIVNHPDLFWGVVMSFWIGNILLVILNLPLIGIWVRLLTVPYRYVYPAILVFVCVGIYSVESKGFDVLVVAAFGAAGYIMRLLGLPPAPLLLGFVLGPMLEENFRRALLMSRGDLATFISLPISAPVLACAGLILTTSLVLWVRKLNSAR
ncbi:MULTISPECIES: tripartite tricarboxylate transporter permease [Chelativorans]|jgi:TctA family transporter|uniref:DUF112 domain-containing protein n=1 Tax=Chelativorans sp. (strain BNC1) TaxID=266779 RepID=Q11FQ3_CHESB|nr:MULTISPECIES: tripartite tricarboxylate transporter permease [Chelativorans]